MRPKHGRPVFLIKLPTTSEEVFWGLNLHVCATVNVSGSTRLVEFLVLVAGRPVRHPFYQPVVYLEVVSGRAAEGILMSPIPLLLPEAVLFLFLFFSPFFPKTTRHLLPTTPHSWFPWMPSQAPSVQCKEYMLHSATGIGVIGQTIGSVSQQ